jgi:hypothetical protein
MKPTQLFLLVAVAVGVSSCTSISSDPGVPKSLLDASFGVSHSLKLGSTRLAINSEQPAAILITVSKFPPSQINHGTGLWFEEDTQDPPRRTYLSSLVIVSKGTSIRFTQDMISPLVEPHWVDFKRDGAKSYVTIDGLDAGDSYRAIFTVENGLILQRLIAHGEFTHEVWERTIYHDDFAEHPDRYKNM